MLTITGLILFTFLWGFAFSGLLDSFVPLKKQLKKSLHASGKTKSIRHFSQRPQF